MREATLEKGQSESVFDDRFGREGVTDEEIAQVRFERGPNFFAVVSLGPTPPPPLSLQMKSIPLCYTVVYFL